MKLFKLFVFLLILLFCSTAFATGGHDGGDSGGGDTTAIGIGVGIGGQGGSVGDVSSTSTNNNTNTNTNTNDAYSSAAARSIGVYDFSFQQNINVPRELLDTPQDNSSSMPIMSSGKIFDYPKMPDYFLKWEYKSGAFKRVKVITWDWDLLSPLGFRYLRATDVEPFIMKKLSKMNAEQKNNFRFKAECFDGMSGEGMHGGLTGSGIATNGLTGLTGALLPGYNRSDYDPKCPIWLYELGEPDEIK